MGKHILIGLNGITTLSLMMMKLMLNIKIISIKNKKLKIKSNLKDSISYLLGKAHLVV